MNVTNTFNSFAELHGLSVPFITEHALRGTKIGKILRKELIKTSPCYADAEMRVSLDQQVKLGVCCWNAVQHVQRVKILSTVEDFINVYNNTAIRSCMTGEGERLTEFYVANKFQLATLWQDGRLMARTLVKDMAFGDLYGDQQEELSTALAESGYINADQHDMFFAPGTEFVVPSKIMNVDGWDGVAYPIPYLDQLGNRILVLVDQTTAELRVKVISAHDPEDAEDEELWLVKDWCQIVHDLCQQDARRVIPVKEAIPTEDWQRMEYVIRPAQIVFMEDTLKAYQKLVRELEDYEEFVEELNGDQE
jgi:hypothetical protein